MFFKSIRDLKKELFEFNNKVKLIFPGTVDYSVKESIRKYALWENTELPGNLTRPEVLNLTLQSNILLLPLNQAENAKGRIPGKLFENLRSKRPILCLGPRNSDVEKILNETGHGKSYEYNDYNGMKTFIADLFDQFLNSGPKTYNGDISQYSVKNQTKKIAGFLDEIVNRNV
jgi:hypothetical protein